jgi:hypothetical protein
MIQHIVARSPHSSDPSSSDGWVPAKQSFKIVGYIVVVFGGE